MTERVCRACGESIPRDPKWSRTYYATRLYCDRTCQAADRPDITADYLVTRSGCWEWQGHVDRNGYGKAYDPNLPVGQRVDWAHRVSYRLHKGPIPADHELDHTCENTVCINPDHLDPVKRPEHARRTMQRLGKDEMQAKAGRLRSLGLKYREIAEVLHLGGKESAAAAVQSAIRKGLVNADDLPVASYLDNADQDDIASLYALGIPQTEIAAWYRVDSSRVSRICSSREARAS